MAIVQDKLQADAFQQQELVTWHYTDGTQCIPVPAVVIRQEAEHVVIKARVRGVVQELSVDPELLVKR